MEEKVINIGNALLAFNRKEALSLNECIAALDRNTSEEDLKTKAPENVLKLAKELVSLSMAETVSLREYLESKGITVQQAVAAAAVEEKEEEIKESENVNLILVKSSGVIKLARALQPMTGKSAMDIKKLSDSAPSVVMENIPRATGNTLIAQLNNELGSDQYEFKLVDA